MQDITRSTNMSSSKHVPFLERPPGVPLHEPQKTFLPRKRGEHHR